MWKYQKWFKRSHYITKDNSVRKAKVMDTKQYVYGHSELAVGCKLVYTLKSNPVKVMQRIDYKLLSLTYKVFTTSQPMYLSKLVSVQSPHTCSTRSSSAVTISRPPTSSSL